MRFREVIMPEYAGIWGQVLAELKLRMTKATFDTWLVQTHLQELTDDKAVITCPNGFAVDWLENRLARPIRDTLTRVLGREVEISFVVATAPPPPEPEEPTPGPGLYYPAYTQEYTEIVQPDKVYVVTHYFRQVWAPRLGPTAAALVIELRNRCWLDWRRGNKEPGCEASREELARALGVSEATIKRLVADVRSKEGDLHLFLSVHPTYYYDKALGKKVQGANQYIVRMDEPIARDEKGEPIGLTWPPVFGITCGSK